MSTTYSAGKVTAYGAAVRGGYTGTYNQFCVEMAEFGDNVDQVAQDRAAVESAVETFTEKTVPDAVENAIQAVDDAAAAQIQNIDTRISARIDDTLTQAGDAADAKKTGDEIGDIKTALDAAPTDATGQEILAEAEAEAFLSGLVLDTIQDYFDNLPRDESLQEIVSELAIENGWLDLLYEEISTSLESA